jgi:hypothetical protein
MDSEEINEMPEFLKEKFIRENTKEENQRKHWSECDNMLQLAVDVLSINGDGPGTLLLPEKEAKEIAEALARGVMNLSKQLEVVSAQLNGQLQALGAMESQAHALNNIIKHNIGPVKNPVPMTPRDGGLGRKRNR